jgi:hypothetical protein
MSLLAWTTLKFLIYMSFRGKLLAADFRLWRDVIHQLCVGIASLSISLGRFICPPLIACRWFTTAHARTLYQVDNDLDTLSYTALWQ